MAWTPSVKLAVAARAVERCSMLVCVLVLASVLSAQARLSVLPSRSAKSHQAAEPPSVYLAGPTVAMPTVSAVEAVGDQVRSFAWSISYTADDSDIVDDQEQQELAYTIKVSRDQGSVSAARVSGSFAVINPNAVPFSLSTLTAQLSDGTTAFPCIVALANELAADSTSRAHFECELGNTSPEGLTLLASASWAEQQVQGVIVPAGSDESQLNLSYEHMSETLVDDCVTVTDTYAGDLIHQLCESDVLRIQRPVSVPAGSCESFRSTAIFFTNSYGAADAASAFARVCISAPLSVALDTIPALTASPAVAENQTTASSAGGAIVRGTALVSNPNTWQAVAAAVEVELAEAGVSCSVQPMHITVAAAGTRQVSYTCTYPAGMQPAAEEFVVVRATWDEAEAYTEESEAEDEAQIIAASPAADLEHTPAPVPAAARAPAMLPMDFTYGSAAGGVAAVARGVSGSVDMGAADLHAAAAASI